MLSMILLITAHPGPAHHFAEFAHVLEKEKIPYQIIAAPAVSKTFQHDIMCIEPSDIEAIKEKIQNSTIVITDVASEKWAEIHQWLAEKHPHIRRICYYENPEPYVPGGYSETAAKVIEKAQEIFFANNHLANRGEFSIDLSGKKTAGIGYYNRQNADQILRLKKDPAKWQDLKKSVTDLKHRVLVYIGGANETYYDEAFPHFVDLISTALKTQPEMLENTTLILQQHPRAKTEGNRDVSLLKQTLAQVQLPKNFHLLISPRSTPETLAIADAVLYYQTSMAAEFALANIPSIAQIGHQLYPDALMNAGYAHPASVEELLQLGPYENQKRVEDQLGIDPNWRENLLKALGG